MGDPDQDPTGLVELAAADPTKTQVRLVPEVEIGPGMMVGEYRIEAKLGVGGMGVVFAAEHPLIRKRAVIKVLRKELCTDPGAIERFVDEARIVNEIGHPNLVDIFAFGQVPDGRHYLVMEWLRGESLASRLERGTPDFDEACAVLRTLARALDAAHKAGVIHRDLKPDNVFLVDTPGELPTVKLLDFGIAKLANTDHRMRQSVSGEIVGTPLYISPEQARALAIDHRADIYSLGVLAFELLSGQTPFTGTSSMEVVAKHLMEAPPRLASVVPGIAPDIDDLVAAMLAKEAADRPDLATVLAAFDPRRAARALSTAPGLERPRRSRLPLLAWLAGGAIVGIAVAAGVVIATSADDAGVLETAAVPPPSPSPSPEPPPPESPPITVAQPPPVEAAATAPAAPPPAAEVAAPTRTVERAATPRVKPPAAAPAASRRAATPEPTPAPVASEPTPTRSAVELAERANTLFVRGAFDAAEAAYREAVAADPDYAPAYRGLGLLYQRIGDASKALKAFRTYLKLVPDGKDAAKIRKRVEELGG